MRATAGSSSNPARPSSPCCGVSRPVSPPRDRRAPLHLAEHGQDPHPGAVPQAGREFAGGRGRGRRGARSARPHRITRVILAPNRPFRGHDRACLALDVTASRPSRRPRRAGTTLHLRLGRHDGLCTNGTTAITGPVTDSSHRQGLLDRRCRPSVHRSAHSNPRTVSRRRSRTTALILRATVGAGSPNSNNWRFSD